ncbi:uncharacterized protein LOC119475986 [Sebastes umbrosus]|uniref:uncharacterized protein LOC119475986 n=1 Tax=Sebastes umbrosus TaxID=72105 RepID=UPI0018A07372|nr:uncharacterized protein LOC119475986 [Sebastes umbrosus]
MATSRSVIVAKKLLRKALRMTASLKRAYLKRDHRKRAQLKRDKLKRAQLKRDHLKRAQLKRDHLKRDHLKRDHQKRDIQTTDLLNTELLNTDLLNTDLLNTDLLSTDLLNKDLLNTDLLNEDLLNTDLLNTDFLNTGCLMTAILTDLESLTEQKRTEIQSPSSLTEIEFLQAVIHDLQEAQEVNSNESLLNNTPEDQTHENSPKAPSAEDQTESWWSRPKVLQKVAWFAIIGMVGAIAYKTINHGI